MKGLLSYFTVGIGFITYLFVHNRLGSTRWLRIRSPLIRSEILSRRAALAWFPLVSFNILRINSLSRLDKASFRVFWRGPTCLCRLKVLDELAVCSYGNLKLTHPVARLEEAVERLKGVI